MPMPPLQRKTIGQQFHQLLVMYCPIELLDFAARLVGGVVSIESLRPMRYLNRWYTSTQALFPDDPVDTYRFKNVVLDVSLTLDQFLSMMPRWNQNGVYAVFTPQVPVKFRATGLKPSSRYVALKEFDFHLEFSLAPSDELSSLVSPHSEVIEQCEQFLIQRGLTNSQPKEPP